MLVLCVLYYVDAIAVIADNRLGGNIDPLVPRPPAGLPLVLACPHKKHTNTNKRGVCKG